MKTSDVFSRSEAIECTKDGVLVIPDTKTETDVDFAYFVVRRDLPRVQTLIIPASVTKIPTMRGDASCGPYGYENNPFEKIIVSEGNPVYASKDGVLFSKDMKTLICYPCGKPDAEYTVPDGVEVIEKEAFLNVEHLEKIRFPESLAKVEEGAFSACVKLHFPDIVDIVKAGNRYFITTKISFCNTLDISFLPQLCVEEGESRFCRKNHYLIYDGEGAASIPEERSTQFLLELLISEEPIVVDDPRTCRRIMEDICSRIEWGLIESPGKWFQMFAERLYSEHN